MRNAQPCAECPFRRRSAPGWLGGHQRVEEILDVVEAGQKFPCHTSVNTILAVHERRGQEPDFERACHSALTCIGSLHYLANAGRAVPNEYVALQVRIVGKKPGVFASRDEIVAHHHPTKGAARAK